MRITHGSRDTFPCPANRCFWLSTYVLHASTTLSSRPLPTFPPCKRNLVFWKRTKSFPSQIVQIRFFNPSFFRFRFLERALVFFVSFLFFIARCIVQNRGRKRAEWVLLLPIPTRFVLSGDYFRSHAPVKYASNNAVVTRFYDFLLSQLCPTTTTALHVHTKLHLAAEIQACFLLFLRGKERFVNRDAIEETKVTRVRSAFLLLGVLGHLVDLEKPTNPEREGEKERESTFTAVFLPRKCLPDSRARKSVGHEKVSRLAL